MTGIKKMYGPYAKLSGKEYSSSSFKPSYRGEEDDEDEEDGDTIDYGKTIKDLASAYRMMQ